MWDSGHWVSPRLDSCRVRMLGPMAKKKQSKDQLIGKVLMFTGSSTNQPLFAEPQNYGSMLSRKTSK